MNTSHWEAKGNKHLDLDLRQTLPYHKQVARLVCKYADANSRIIDLGCGLGHIEGQIKQMRPELSIDIADAYDACLAKTSEKGNVGQAFKIDEVQFDVHRQIPADYDIAIMSHVLEHLLFPAKALEDVFSILRPSGIIIVAVPNPARPAVLLTNLFKMHYVNRGHVHSWDTSHWRNFLENIMDYEAVEYATDFIQIPFSTRIGLLQRIGTAAVRLAPWWGFSNIAVIKRKPDSNSLYQQWTSKEETEARPNDRNVN